MSVQPLEPARSLTGVVVQPIQNTFRWATVTDDVPLTIRLDGDSQPLPIVPDSLIEGSPPAVGKRVWVQLFGRRVIIIGVSAAP